MLDFSLSPEQQNVRHTAAAFAAGALKNARAAYTKLPDDGVTRFNSTKPIFETATKLGIVKSLVPTPLGGTGGTLVDSALITEELFAVEPSVALSILTINMGLMPLLFSAGKEELQKEVLAPFLTGTGTPLATFHSSEPCGSANFMEKGGRGLQTTARHDPEKDEWVVNGDKIWSGNSAGWDGKGADVLTILCRNPDIKSDNAKDAAMIIIGTREVIDANVPGAYKVVEHKVTPGFTACSGPHVRFTDLRIPSKFVVATGTTAAGLIAMTFTASATMVGAMGVGIMRATFEAALKYAKENTAGGSVKILERQSPADLLIAIKIRADTARLLTWKAAHALDTGTPGAAEMCFAAKIYASEAAVTSVAEAMRVVGISSYSKEMPFGQLMEDALVLPIFDGGNQGVRRREIQTLFLAEDYKPWQCSFETRD
ncbi:acyl-CoA dehydrogenase [Venturia nashicola]|uniref:Acyl-CoA dehydrogenase n=1 Tax=Venturia nashicola TaxID=86259 RepID=A0A4Z1PNW5_9PEZI|nr:acyl-CoA dehydrogenase [Venturia nashicola]